MYGIPFGMNLGTQDFDNFLFQRIQRKTHMLELTSLIINYQGHSYKHGLTI